MICNGSVTVYKLRETTDAVWEREYFPEVYVYGGRGAALTDFGDRTSGETIVRIPTELQLDISAGDRLTMGMSESSAPPDGSFIVTGVFDNRTGCRQTKHYRLVVE